jgi:hypothetical protein
MTQFETAIAYLFVMLIVFGSLWAFFSFITRKTNHWSQWDEPDYRSVDRRFRGEK